jgi:hypothetical protein
MVRAANGQPQHGTAYQGTAQIRVRISSNPADASSTRGNAVLRLAKLVDEHRGRLVDENRAKRTDENRAELADEYRVVLAAVERLDEDRAEPAKDEVFDDVEHWRFGCSVPEDDSPEHRFQDYVFLQRLSSALRTTLSEDLRSRRRPS